MAEEEKNEKEEQQEGGAAEGGEGGEAAEGGEGGSKKPSKKKLILLALLIVIVLAVPAILFLAGVFDSKHEEVEAGKMVEGEDGKAVVLDAQGMPEQPVFYDMEEFVVNLNVGSKRPSFLKMSVSLELPGVSQIPAIEEKMPRIRDGFQVYLRELRQEDLQGAAGMYRLREELLLRINKIVYPAKVNDILFKEILVQ